MGEETTYTRDQWESAIRRWFPFAYDTDTHPALEAVLGCLNPSGSSHAQGAFKGYAYPNASDEGFFEETLRINLDHSALIYWILEGNEPLEHPPPKYMSRPWHSLIAEGEGELLDPPRQFFDDVWVIGQDTKWRLLEERESSWVLEYPNHGKWVVETLPLQKLKSGHTLQKYRISRYSDE